MQFLPFNRNRWRHDFFNHTQLMNTVPPFLNNAHAIFCLSSQPPLNKRPVPPPPSVLSLSTAHNAHCVCPSVGHLRIPQTWALKRTPTLSWERFAASPLRTLLTLRQFLWSDAIPFWLTLTQFCTGNGSKRSQNQIASLLRYCLWCGMSDWLIENERKHPLLLQCSVFPS